MVKMNNISIFFSLFILCCVENGYSTTKSECAALTGIPDPDSGCCGVDVYGSKLIGGYSTELGQYPWLALIEYLHKDNGDLKPLCGGTLISTKYVLTAAHCLTPTPLRTYTPTNVRLGEHNLTNIGPDCFTDGTGSKDCTDGETTIPIDKYILHPDFILGKRANDIALIKMKENAPYTDFIHPICLPTSDVALKNGRIQFIMSSWGTSHGPSDVKLRVTLPLVEQSICNEAFKRGKVILSSGQICAGGVKDQDSCRGDAGMPLMYENGQNIEAAGIVSFGWTPCGQEGVPSVYTNVYVYKSWIISNAVA